MICSSISLLNSQFMNILSKNKKLNLFIYNVDTLRKYQFIDTLINRKMYKRLEYSERQLEELKWVIVVK
jgi:hypothetical protein